MAKMYLIVTALVLIALASRIEARSLPEMVEEVEVENPTRIRREMSKTPDELIPPSTPRRDVKDRVQDSEARPVLCEIKGAEPGKAEPCSDYEVMWVKNGDSDHADITISYPTAKVVILQK